MTQAYYSYLCSMRPESQTLLYRVWFPFCKTNLHWEYINCTIYWYSTVLWRSWFSLPESQYVGRLLVCLLLMLVWWLSRTLSVFGCDSNWFIWYLGWLWPYHLLHFTIHGTMWGAHMVFLEILMCSLRVRPLHDHYMVVLSYFSTDGGKVWMCCCVLLWPNQVHQLHGNMPSCFHMVFTNHDEVGWPLIVCDITWKPSSLLSVRGVWPALYHVHILLLYHKTARVGDRAKNTKKYSASNPDSVGFARSDPHSLWMWWVTNFSGSFWYDSH